MSDKHEAVDPTEEPRRTLRLLWRASLTDEAPKRGPRPRASTDEIVRSAVAIADEEGIDAVTMRSVAERVGVGAMTLYGYVPGRSELLGLMIDEVAGEAPRAPHAGGLGERVVAIAEELMAEYRRHPWRVDARLPRPWIGPHLSDRYEWQLAGIDGFGLDDITMDQVVTTIRAFVDGIARGWVAEQERMALGESDLEWWLQTGAVLEEVMDGSRYPVSGRVGQAAGEDYGLGDAERSFRFGLEMIVVGAMALADRASS
ncbi:transcriptional regulator, TetR family [Agrococcus baldri]|uniref:Transcriptional regulator, TetR family n=1 Tax=Agrococcus baldri TaxID=153730 RepID=A0AA94KYJ8_9MICO|nr:TetR/AcrR family transcriptional regulator [Agrococcus baldri]SFR99266.1 transcriptional regulator, TetR family [Agrococcus baldri]